jgi:hypothetical protein
MFFCAGKGVFLVSRAGVGALAGFEADPLGYQPWLIQDKGKNNGKCEGEIQGFFPIRLRSGSE